MTGMYDCFLVHRCEPKVLTSGFLGSVMLFVRDLLPVKPKLAHQVIRDILLDFSLWSKSTRARSAGAPRTSGTA